MSVQGQQDRLEASSASDNVRSSKRVRFVPLKLQEYRHKVAYDSHPGHSPKSHENVEEEENVTSEGISQDYDRPKERENDTHGSEDIDEVLHTNPQWYRTGDFLNEMDNIGAGLDDNMNRNAVLGLEGITQSFEGVGSEKITPGGSKVDESRPVRIKASDNIPCVSQNHSARNSIEVTREDEFDNQFANHVLDDGKSLDEYSFELLGPADEVTGYKEDNSLNVGEFPLDPHSINNIIPQMSKDDENNQLVDLVSINSNFKCSVDGCSRSFKKIGNYIIHLENHTTEYKCNFTDCSVFM